MTTEHANIIRAQARKCIAECHAATAISPRDRDAVRRPIILRHYSVIEPICQPFSLFLWNIGLLTGAVQERG